MMEIAEELWDFWDEAGLHCSGYDSEQDRHLIEVFIETGKADNWFEAIAKRLELDAYYVMLLIEILCSAGFCEYGTSPRSAWAIHGTYKDNVKKLLDWYRGSWDGDVSQVRNEVTGSEIE
jgi:hypothetical protein